MIPNASSIKHRSVRLVEFTALREGEPCSVLNEGGIRSEVKVELSRIRRDDPLAKGKGPSKQELAVRLGYVTVGIKKEYPSSKGSLPPNQLCVLFGDRR
jgi:hypothetical protein